MSTFTIVMIVILVILIGVLVGLYICGQKAEKKQAEQQEQMAAAAQVVSMLIIDKKKLRLKEAGLPQSMISWDFSISTSFGTSAWIEAMLLPGP